MQTFGFIEEEEEEGKVQLFINLPAGQLRAGSVCEGAKRTIQHVFKTL